MQPLASAPASAAKLETAQAVPAARAGTPPQVPATVPQVLLQTVDLRISSPTSTAPRTWYDHLRSWRLPILCVLLPTLIGFIYWAFIASPRFTSRADFYLKQERDAGDALSGSLLGFALGTGASANDDLVVASYIQSLDLLHQIDQDLGVKAHFQDAKWDFFSRLPRDATDLQFLEYAKRRIHVAHDASSGLTTVTVQAFDPRFAQRMMDSIIAHSERLVNELGHRMVRERQAFLEQELAQARNELEQAKQRLIAFQDQNGVIDAHGEATAIGTIAADLHADLARERVVLAEMLSEQPEGSDAVQRQRARIAGIEEQLAAERQRLAGDGKTKHVNEIAARQQDLETEVSFKAEAYKVATVAYEQARSELNQKLKHLLVVVQPSLPDEASDPAVLYDTLTLFVAVLMAYGIGRMVAATIREHRD